MSTALQSTLSFAYNIATTGLGGIALVGFWQRWIVPGSAYNDMKAERDEWKNLYETERTAHQATRDALILSSQRSEAGVEAARLALPLIEVIREQGGRRSDDK